MLDPIEIVDAPQGYRDQVRFARVSGKPRIKGRLMGTSRLTDYLLSTGTEPVRSEDPQAWVDAIESTAGQMFEFFVDWRAYDSDTEENLADSYADFPSDGNGGRQSWVVNPKTGKRVAAQYFIRYFIRNRG